MCGPKDYQTIEDAMEETRRADDGWPKAGDVVTQVATVSDVQATLEAGIASGQDHGTFEVTSPGVVTEAAVQAIRDGVARGDGFVLYVVDSNGGLTRGYGSASLDDMQKAANAMSNDLLDMLGPRG